MLISRQNVLRLVKDLPKQVDFDDLVYRIYLQHALAASEKDIRAGRTLSHQQVLREVRKWFK